MRAVLCLCDPAALFPFPSPAAALLPRRGPSEHKSKKRREETSSVSTTTSTSNRSNSSHCVTPATLQKMGWLQLLTLLVWFYNMWSISIQQPSGLLWSSNSFSDNKLSSNNVIIHLYIIVCLQAEAPPLCPYPSLRIGSPRRVLLSHNHAIYISPHKSPSPLPPRDKIFYYISSSPSNVR